MDIILTEINSRDLLTTWEKIPSNEQLQLLLNEDLNMYPFLNIYEWIKNDLTDNEYEFLTRNTTLTDRHATTIWSNLTSKQKELLNYIKNCIFLKFKNTYFAGLLYVPEIDNRKSANKVVA